jgi:hypothetical protein
VKIRHHNRKTTYHNQFISVLGKFRTLDSKVKIGFLKLLDPSLELLSKFDNIAGLDDKVDGCEENVEHLKHFENVEVCYRERPHQ